MNILHVIPGLTWERGGPSTVVQALARHQAGAGHDVTVLTTDQGARHGERPVDMPSAVTVERLNVRGPDRLAYAPGFAQALRGHLRCSDVVHIHSIFTYPVHAALREARAAQVPAVLRPCGLLHRYSLRRSSVRKRLYLAGWGRMVRESCSAWHYTSQREAAESWPGDGSPHFVVPNGVEPLEFAVDRDQARQRLSQLAPQLDGHPYVLFLGRLHAKKRLDILLDAFLSAAPAPLKLVVAGPDESGLWNALAKRWLHDADAQQRVVRVGTITGPDKAVLLAGASLFALPSEHENFGVAALEALASGTPVLLSPHVDLGAAAAAAGLAHIAVLNRTAWREKLESLLSDLPALRVISEEARRFARANYSWACIAEQLVSQYKGLRASPGRCTKSVRAVPILPE